MLYPLAIFWPQHVWCRPSTKMASGWPSRYTAKTTDKRNCSVDGGKTLIHRGTPCQCKLKSLARCMFMHKTNTSRNQPPQHPFNSPYKPGTVHRLFEWVRCLCCCSHSGSPLLSRGSKGHKLGFEMYKSMQTSMDQ